MSQAMRTFMDAQGVQRLEAYFQRIGDVLGEDSRRGSFAIYAMGLLGVGERKSIVPPFQHPAPSRRPAGLPIHLPGP